MAGLLPHHRVLSFRTGVNYLVPKVDLVNTARKLVCFKHPGPLHEPLQDSIWSLVIHNDVQMVRV